MLKLVTSHLFDVPPDIITIYTVTGIFNNENFSGSAVVTINIYPLQIIDIIIATVEEMQIAK